MKSKDISLVIPVYNEASGLRFALQQLLVLKPWLKEIILVDGGSTDGTCDIVAEYDHVSLIAGPRGRAAQMMAGAKQASACQLLFCHIDSSLNYEHLQAIPEKKTLWGCFNVMLDGKDPIFRIIEFFINLRSRLTGISTGDQCLLVDTSLFWQVGGFANIPLMEDIEICQRLNKLQKPRRFKPAVVTSSRRWQQNGVVKTVVLMWRLRFAYWRGIPADQLAKIYYPDH